MNEIIKKILNLFLLSSILLLGLSAYAGAVTVTPSTWNIIGLDSNDQTTGPNRFPVGAKVCGGVEGNSGTATFAWDDTPGSTNPESIPGTYIYLRAGTANPVTFTYGADGCADAFFEVELARNANAFDKTRKYVITSGGVSTPTPREIYVEHLISQGRNAITNLEYGDPEGDGTCDEGTPLTSITAGGSFSIIVGSTNCIRMSCYTATAGYQQLESFVSFPNTIFQVLGVSTTYSADTYPGVPPSSGDPILYADACSWENDPNSPNYLSCYGDGKVGGTMQVTYKVKILSTGTGQENITSLVHDFSGSSFHYNSDYDTGGRTMNIVDPASLTISKSFSPNPTNAGGVSALTFTVSNPTGAEVSGLNFTDTFPTSPGAMVVADNPGATTTGCGTSPAYSPVAGSGSISFADGTVGAYGTCKVKVNVTVPSPTTGTYNNSSSNLFIGAVDTGDDGNDSLTVNNALPAPDPVCGLTLAKWTFPSGFSTTAPVASTANVTSSASIGGGLTPQASTATSTADGTGSWMTNGDVTTGATLNTANNEYFQFNVDTTGYTSTYLYFNAERKLNNSPHGVAVYGNDSTSGPVQLYSTAEALTSNTTWFPFGTGDSLPITGNDSTASARIYFFNSGNSNPGSDVYLDDVAFFGCAIPDPPTITKNFSPDPIAVDGTSTLTFTIVNPNSSMALSGISFSDTFPPNMFVAATPAVTTSNCGTPTFSPAGNDSSLSFSGGSLSAGGTCTVSVDVTVTEPDSYNNVSGFVSSTQSGVNDGADGIATDSLTAVLPPSISKQFAPNPIIAGNDSTLTFIIANPNLDFPISGVAFSDTFPVAPAAMKVALTPNATTSGCGSPTFAPSGNDSSISFTGGTIAAGATCRVAVDVYIPLMTTGDYANTSGAVTHTINAASVGADTASDTLTVTPVHPAISILKQVSDSVTGPWSSYVAVAGNDSVYYKFTVENPGDVDLASVSISDPDVALSGCSWNPLAKYDSQTCTGGPVLAAVGQHVNTATVTGTYSSTPYSGNDSATYATVALGFDKSVAEAAFTGNGNDSLHYSYVVSNSGAATLVGPVTVTDDKATVVCPAVSTAVLISNGNPGDGDNYLDPGEQITCTATYPIVAGDVTAKSVTNIASGTISGVTTATDTVTVPLAPDMSVSKNNDVGDTVLLGNDFDWMLFVSNATSAGSAFFADGQTILQDDLPTSGATYSLGTVRYSGTTGTINCAIADNVLTCLASGAVTIPDTLQGTIAVGNDSATVTGSGTAFSTQLGNDSRIDIAGTVYGVSSIESDTSLTLSTNYAGATASGIKVPGSFNVPITVSPTAGGFLVNPRGGGVCAVDPGTVLLERDDANNSCANTVTVGGLPSLTIVKSVQSYSDPINGTVDPKAIPGSFMTYTILVTNTGTGAADNNTTVVTDQIPANTDLFVGDISGGGSGPVLFTDGATASGLSYTFTSLNDGNDSLSFSADGADYGKSDTAADGNGCDATVNYLKVSLGGILGASDGTNHPSFSLKFRVRVE